MLDKEWLFTWAPIGIFKSTQHWKAIASGIFIYDNPFIWYVTSHQQICTSSTNSLYVLLKHKKKGQILFDISSMHKREKIEWIVDEHYNMAATLFPTDPDFELKAVGFDYFLPSKDMLTAMNCFSIGYPYELAEQDTKNIAPFVLEGIISKIEEKRSIVYVTTPIFLENYGSPLFLWKSPFNSSHSIVLGNPSIYFGGIMTDTIIVENSTKKALGIMSPSEVVKNLLFSAQALSQKEKLNKKIAL